MAREGIEPPTRGFSGRQRSILPGLSRSISDRPATTSDRSMEHRASPRTLEYRGVQVLTRYRNFVPALRHSPFVQVEFDRPPGGRAGDEERGAPAGHSGAHLTPPPATRHPGQRRSLRRSHKFHEARTAPQRGPGRIEAEEDRRHVRRDREKILQPLDSRVLVSHHHVDPG